MAIVSLFIFLDIITQAFGAHRGLWAPLIEELSSGLTMTATLLIPAAVAIWLRRARRPWWQAAAMHGGAVVAYLVVHVGGFLLLRQLATRVLFGHAYDFGRMPGALIYEAAKDIPAYAFAVTATWLILRWLQTRDALRGNEPASFDIRDGARIVRVQVADILAVRSAGNYVEFLLGDGRSPLMRAALSSVEPKLADLGFVRTHRSWLVNSARMSGLRPEGSGDYTVELGKLEAPLSRRFPKALARLRS